MSKYQEVAQLLKDGGFVFSKGKDVSNLDVVNMMGLKPMEYSHSISTVAQGYLRSANSRNLVIHTGYHPSVEPGFGYMYTYNDLGIIGVGALEIILKENSWREYIGPREIITTLKEVLCSVYKGRINGVEEYAKSLEHGEKQLKELQKLPSDVNLLVIALNERETWFDGNNKIPFVACPRYEMLREVEKLKRIVKSVEHLDQNSRQKILQMTPEEIAALAEMWTPKL